MTLNGDECAFRVLGPVQVISAGAPMVFARRQQLDLLAFLLLHAGRVVAVDQIVDAMWGEAVPRTASTQIKNMMSALRGALNGGDRAQVSLDRQPAGYRLRLTEGELDLAVFTGLVADARSAADPARRAGLLRRALDLWQGPHALAGVRASFAGAARTHLEEQRDSAQEALFEAELECANHIKIVPELTAAVAENPGRERLVGQLMLALYRGGRPTEALAAYRHAREVLAEEYGLEPGTALRDLERLILLGDPALQLPGPPRSPPAREPAGHEEAARPGARTATPVPAQLPLDVRCFAGRAAELAALDRLIAGPDEGLSTVVVVAVMGTAGVGKTALAVHWAHQVRGRFPDGQLYVNLRGFDPGGAAVDPAEAVRGFLDAFGVPPERIPADLTAQSALYRSLVAGRRMLVVLDNAVSTEQVRPLLPGSPGCLVVVTSRSRLTGLVAAEAAYPLTLDVLSDEEARELLAGRLGADRVATEAGAVDALAAACAGLPLALAMVAARAAIHPTFPLTALAAELTQAGDTPAGGGDAATDVRTVLSWSYHRLGPAAAGMFRRLGLHAGPDIATPAAASLDGATLARAHVLLAELANSHLVTEHTRGRFGLHDLLRAYAAEMAAAVDPPEDRGTATRRLVDHYLHTASSAALLLYPHRYRIPLVAAADGVCLADLRTSDQALGWFGTEHANLVAAVKLAADAGLGAHAWQLATTVGTYFDRRGHWRDWAATQATALAAAERSGDRLGQAHASSGLGFASTRLGHHAGSHEHLRRALAIFGELDDPIGQAYTHLRISSVYGAQAEQDRALRHAERALDLYEAAGHRAGQAQALNNIGWYETSLGRHRDALAHCAQAVELHRALDDQQGTAHALDSLGFAHHNLGAYDLADRHYREALAILRRAGDRYYEAITLTHLGDAGWAAGRPDDARRSWGHAVEILDELDHPDAERIRAKLRMIGRMPSG